MHRGLWWANVSKGGHLEDLRVDRRIILKWLLIKWDGRVDLNNVAQDREKR
jgi:hypothetical protein